VTVATGALAGCSSNDAADAGGTTTISFLTQNGPQNIKYTRQYIAAFEKKYPDIVVKMNTMPGGSESDNITKTKLSTGNMDDVFYYNAGSLLRALDPDKTLVDLSDQSWVKHLTPDFKTVVTTSKGVYGAPLGTSFAGGIVYNKKVYAQLGLKVPTSWDDFMANSKKIKAELPDVAPVIQAYGDDNTAQLFVLADFANVARQNPNWASRYTQNKAKYAEQPALAGFLHQQEAYDAGLFNADFASTTNDQAVKMLATGKGAQYPILSNVIGSISTTYPEAVDDIGFFAMPADDAKNTSATIWEPNALYIPKTTTGAERDAAKKFIAWLSASKEGCAMQNKTGIPSGPYVIETCSVTAGSAPLVHDLQTYYDEHRASPALEFLSPIKGPNLPAITVQVGSGITPGKQGAELYDQDVVKQAQQLGLAGW
jgi:raffinose/stachyose/melibiose transport system substrate-binding protein